jgi:hypothetical protein
MDWKKTPEQIAEEQRLFKERYPDAPPAPQYDMPEELKAHAYDLFPALKDIVPGAKNVIPYAPDQAPSEEEQAPQQQLQEQQPQATPQVREPSSQTPAVQAAVEPKQEDQDYQSAIEQSSKNARNARLNAQFARVRDAAIGAGLGAKFEADNTIYKELQANADEPLKKMVLANELKEKKSKDDPNSQISQLVRKSLSEMGMNMEGLDGVSYSQIEKIYPSLANSIMTKMAAEAKRDERALMREMKAENKSSADLDKVGQSVDKQIAQLRTSKEFTSYEQAKAADSLLQAALASNQPLVKVEDAAAFMNYAKTAQGDDSVVRSEDMKVLAGNMGFNNVNEMLSKFSSKAKGSAFSKGELQAMSRVLQTIKNVKREKIQQRLSPIKYKADKTGYDLNQSITPEYMDEIFAPMPLSVEAKAKRLQELKAKQGK